MSKVLQPLLSINKYYRREIIPEDDLLLFSDELKKLLSTVSEEGSEENNKGFFKTFLQTALYPLPEYSIQTDYHGIDLTIHCKANKEPLVIFEVKGPGLAEMVSTESLCKKAMFQLVFYYIREEFKYKNNNIKHLVITDCQQMFIFEKSEFFRFFGEKKSFVKQVLDADNSNERTVYIYNQIIRPLVEQIEDKIEYTYIDLRKLKDKGGKSRSLKAAYKFLSPVHLLKFSYYNTDHNQLNTEFYNELLYVMGVKEVTDGGQKKIVRLGANARQRYSLLEQTMHELECYNIESESEKFDIAMGLVINWINRVIFLKLLEAQMLSLRNDAKRILTLDRVPNFHVLNDLFWHILAKDVEQRPKDIKEWFADIPYLNSALFEVSDIEKKYFRINALDDTGEMRVYAQTVLRDEKAKHRKGSLRSLDYLLQFLDAYNFGGGRMNTNEHRTIIDASVLGLIFEKINGYKDGSFYTPGYITEFICNEVIEDVVVEKFNQHYALQCKSLDDLCDSISFSNIDEMKEANKLVNSIHVCDPSVGSGHFLVSALNELLAIKSRLGILLYKDSTGTERKFRSYNIMIADDEIVIRDAFGDDFVYVPSEPESLTIQKMLFEEKRTIIENCLFGVDINPKSVEICRLRLWIELLKHTYYFKDNAGAIRLQTLPNIDINIKAGDSLASRLTLRQGKAADSSVYYAKDIVKYKALVAEYKNCNDKTTKRKLVQSLHELKDNIMYDLVPNFFTPYIKQNDELRFFKTSMEWMIEFPEVLDDKGVFQGFDIIVGNPPYIPLGHVDGANFYKKMEYADPSNPHRNVYEAFDGQGDVYVLFVERALQLLKPSGRLSFILPNKWVQSGYGSKIRKMLLDKHLMYMVDLVDNQVFGDATTYTCIISIKNEDSAQPFRYHKIGKLNKNTLHKDVKDNVCLIDKTRLDEGIWTISSREAQDIVCRLKNSPEMQTLGEAVSERCNRGILTGLSEVFNEISDELKEQLINEHASAAEILRPILSGEDINAFEEIQAVKNLLFIPKGFTIKSMRRDYTDKPSEEEAWQWFENKYPSVAKYLQPYKDKARKRGDKGDYWWELRACAYYDSFAEPKIYYQAISTKPCFTFDDQGVFCNNSMFFISTAEKGYVSLLNSSTGWWLINEFCPLIRGGRQLLWENLKQIPVPRSLPARLGELNDEMREAIISNNNVKQTEISNEINDICSKLYGIKL